MTGGKGSWKEYREVFLPIIAKRTEMFQFFFSYFLPLFVMMQNQLNNKYIHLFSTFAITLEVHFLEPKSAKMKRDLFFDS